MARNVDLPEPLWPTSATDWPRGHAEGERVERDEVGVVLGRLGRRRGSARRVQPWAPACSICCWKHAPMSSRTRTQPHTSDEHDGDRRAPAVTAAGAPGSPRSMAAPGEQHRQRAEDRQGRGPRASGTPAACPAPPAARATSVPAGGRRPGQHAHERAGHRAERERHGGDRRDVGRAPGRRRAPRPRPSRPRRRAAWPSDPDRHVAQVDGAGIERRRRRGGWGGRPPGRAPRRCRARRRTAPARRAATSGVVPAHAPRRARPADHAEEHEPGEPRGRPPEQARRPRVNTGARPVAADRHRTHGRSRGSSIASWRRSTMTVRRSCSVAAKRSWPTRRDRRSAASSDVRPSRATPTATSTDADDRRDEAER